MTSMLEMKIRLRKSSDPAKLGGFRTNSFMPMKRNISFWEVLFFLDSVLFRIRTRLLGSLVKSHGYLLKWHANIHSWFFGFASNFTHNFYSNRFIPSFFFWSFILDIGSYSVGSGGKVTSRLADFNVTVRTSSLLLDAVCSRVVLTFFDK